MARIAYLDCFSGVSGDMLLGALLDAGVPLQGLRAELARVPLKGYRLTTRPAKRAGFAATQAVVSVSGHQTPRRLSEVLDIIENCSLPRGDKKQGAAVFRRLAEAEAAVHGETVDSVQLHDAGAVDAIVDVMGAIAGLRLLGVERLYASPLALGAGHVDGAHGRLPVPAPATLELLARAGAPVRPSAAGSGELVTPTGAAIVTTLASFERPEMTLQGTGCGAGSRDITDTPNVLRLWLGEEETPGACPMVVLETNIDDMTAEMLAYAQERLLAAGASDAWFTAIQMKKGRPGVMLSVLCPQPLEDALVRLLLSETSTLGVRVRPVQRFEAEREVMEFESSLGPAAVKVKRLPGEPPRFAPEYEACRRLAEKTGLAIQEVYRIVQEEAGRLSL